MAIAVNQCMWLHFKNVGWRSLLLLLAATSAATISLLEISCNLTLTVNTIPSQVRQHKYYVTWFQENAVIGCNTFASWIFPTRLKACNYCMQKLQRVACSNCIAHVDKFTFKRPAQWTDVGDTMLEFETLWYSKHASKVEMLPLKPYKGRRPPDWIYTSI